ncbi:MAG: type II toxin-antitoxin system Phd/YefM family antitoxin [Deltaproteobacteria bacterium]|nr:type II toxin-antitoxin system Phd/YefM family antitoxin [Deltaproteobacteria bacterium]
MKSVNIQQAKTHLSRHIRRVKRGETLIICDRNKPVAELRPLATSSRPDRPLGVLRGALLHMSDDFNAPLSSEELAAFTDGDPTAGGK